VASGSSQSEIAQVLRDSRARVFIFSAAVADKALAAMRGDVQLQHFAVGPKQGLPAWEAAWKDASQREPADATAGDTLSYTSGTSGTPRAVRRPIGGASLARVGKLAAAHLRVVARIRPRSNAVHLVCSPLYHSASLLWCMDHLHVGHTVCLMRKWSPIGMLERVQREKITGALMVPTHFHRLLALPRRLRERYDVSSLRHVIHTGAACPVAIKKQMLGWWGPVIYEVYGATEGGGTRVGPDEWLVRPGTVGPSRGRVVVLQEDGSRCRPGEVGLVYLRFGPSRFEYQGDVEKTQSTRRGNYFTVGDIGYLDEDGYLFLCGRDSDLIISGGVNIYPAQIEQVLGIHPAVKDVAVFGAPDAEWGEQVKAAVQLHAGIRGDEALAAELKAYCTSELASFKCPKTIEFVESLPRGENGKLYKKELRERHHSVLQ
jgi:long-chain acyl-CoA synthetase